MYEDEVVSRRGSAAGQQQVSSRSEAGQKQVRSRSRRKPRSPVRRAIRGNSGFALPTLACAVLVDAEEAVRRPLVQLHLEVALLTQPLTVALSFLEELLKDQQQGVA